MSKKFNLLRVVTITSVICSTVSFSTLLSSSAKAATISGITLGPETSVASSTTVNNVTYQGYSKSITSFASGGNNWNIVNPSVDTTLTVQRSGNTGIDSNKQIIWERCTTSANCTYPSASNTLRGTLPTTTQAALTQNNIYLGTDNFFANTGNGAGNQSDVERVDFVFSTGYYAASNVGITVFDRGVTTVHDAFSIAAITGFDASGKPTYSSLKSYAQGWGATDLLTGTEYTNNATVNNGNNGASPFAVTASGAQNIGGELVLLTDLVSANTPVYGYSLFAQDTFNAVTATNCTLAQLSNVANTNCYANTTLEVNGGIDLVAANMGVTVRSGTSATKIPEPLSIVGTVLGGIASIGIRKRIKAISK
jgi:hypothetical protein